MLHSDHRVLKLIHSKDTKFVVIAFKNTSVNGGLQIFIKLAWTELIYFNTKRVHLHIFTMFYSGLGCACQISPVPIT